MFFRLSLSDIEMHKIKEALTGRASFSWHLEQYLLSSALFIMRPGADDFDCFYFLVNAIYQAMFPVDPSGVCA